LRLIAGIAWLIIARTTIVALVSAATATTAITTALVTFAILSLAGFGGCFRCLGGLAAEEAFKPTKETTGRFGGFFRTAWRRLTRLRSARLESGIASWFALLERPGLARLKRFWFAWFERF
jgi:hypothetical protein